MSVRAGASHPHLLQALGNMLEPHYQSDDIS